MAPTRRELLKGGVAAGAAAAAGGTVWAALAPTAQAASPQAGALVRALEIEQLVVVAYRQAIATGLLNLTVKTQLQTHLTQEAEHVAILQRAASAQGVTPPPAPSVAVAQDELERHQIHWSLTHLRSQHDCLKLLVDVESLVENAYFQAVEKLADPSLVGTCAEIMGCESQHWTVLSGFLNHEDATKAVPYPFVQGTP